MLAPEPPDSLLFHMANNSTPEGRIPTQIALALLESLRDVDMPADRDALGEPDLPLNLQRRLGLSTVIVDQIRRYERRRTADVPAAEVASLFELIGRRPDASRIFVEAGQRIARADLEGRRVPSRLGTRMLPQALRERGALKRARKIARRLSPGSSVSLRHKPHALIVQRGLPATAARDGAGCAVVAGAIKYVFQEFRAGDFRVVHDCCEARSGDRCEWLVTTEATTVPVGGASTASAPPIVDGHANGAGEPAQPPVSQRVTPAP